MVLSVTHCMLLHVVPWCYMLNGYTMLHGVKWLCRVMLCYTVLNGYMVLHVKWLHGVTHVKWLHGVTR